MEMMEMVSKVVSTLKGDKSMLSAFSADPVKIVTSILGRESRMPHWGTRRKLQRMQEPEEFWGRSRIFSDPGSNGI